MLKTVIHTNDIFNFADDSIRMRYFDFCHKKALKCGLKCACHIDGLHTRLELWGTKYQFVKYYLATLLKCEYKMDGFKRLIAILK